MGTIEDRFRGALERTTRGDAQSAAELLRVVYDELRGLAAARLAVTPPGQTVQATELVHEAYIRLVGSADPGWAGRGHFFGAAARAIRNVMVDRYRAARAAKRGGDRRREEMDSHIVGDGGTDLDILDVDEALGAFAEVDPRAARVVELRFFAGLTGEETAEALGCSPETVKRDWAYAKRWLRDRLARDDGADSP